MAYDETTFRRQSDDQGDEPARYRANGFTATGVINRHDFGVSWNAAIEGGGVVIGDKVTINIEAELILDQPAS